MLDLGLPVAIPLHVRVLKSMPILLLNLTDRCTNRSNPSAWNTLSNCKTRVLEFVWSPTVPNGVKLAAVKFLQRVILVQTRGIPDPRVCLELHHVCLNPDAILQLQNKNDPNISFCPPDHPFISVVKLEAEGQKLIEGQMSLLYSSQ